MLGPRSAALLPVQHNECRPDSEAELLTEAVERRRPTSRRALPVGGGVVSVGRLAGRVQRRFHASQTSAFS